VVAPVFTDEELEGLRRFPEIGREDLFRFFTLAPADVAFVDPGRGRGPADRLGLAVAVCTLPWLGFVADEVASAPRAAVVRLAEQLDVDPAAIRSYGRRAKTRTEHLRLRRSIWDGVRRRRWSWRSATSSCWRGRWSTTRRRCFSGWSEPLLSEEQEAQHQRLTALLPLVRLDRDPSEMSETELSDRIEALRPFLASPSGLPQ
jgi:hypothetical protein